MSVSSRQVYRPLAAKGLNISNEISPTVLSIVNLSHLTGTFPSHHFISVPISKNPLSNYQSISNLSLTSKITEKNH